MWSFSVMAEGSVSLQNRFIFCVFQASEPALSSTSSWFPFITMSREGTELRFKMKKTFPSFEVDFGI